MGTTVSERGLDIDRRRHPNDPIEVRARLLADVASMRAEERAGLVAYLDAAIARLGAVVAPVAESELAPPERA